MDKNCQQYLISQLQLKWFGWFNTMKPEQNGRQLADGNFKSLFMEENVCVLIQISPEFVPNGRINSKSTLVQGMTWGLFGPKPSPETMLTMCHDAIWHHYTIMIYMFSKGWVIFSHLDDICMHLKCQTHFWLTEFLQHNWSPQQTTHMASFCLILPWWVKCPQNTE